MKNSKASKGIKGIKLGIFLSSAFLFGFAFFVYYVVFGFNFNVKTAIAGTEPPIVTVILPVNADIYTTNFNIVDLSGTASDNVGIVDISWVNDATGDIGVPAGIYAWSISNIALDPGVNNITITARDAAGNEASDTLEVTYIELTADNASTRGFAWSSNAGWISVNSKDCDNDDDGYVDSGMCGGNDDASTPVFSYGVNISNTATHYGDFSGYAWSSNYGWISFEEIVDVPDYNFSVNCEQPSTCDGPEDACTACFNSGTGEIYGWAKVLALNEDGWIKLRSEVGDGGGTYGLSISGNGEIEGFTWGGGDVQPGIGWVSFNCNDYSSCLAGSEVTKLCTDDSECNGDTCGDTCSLSPYAVTANVNNPPTVRFIPMDSPGHCNYNCACGLLGPLNPQLLWRFSDLDPGDVQEKYQIFFDKANHTLAELDAMTDYLANEPHLKTPIFDGDNQSFYPATNVYRNISVDYNTTYYAWVKVWDDKGADSGWVSLDLNGVDLEFTTYVHGFPVVGDIAWIPEKPSAGEPVKFDEDASVYELSSPADLVSCDNDSSICAWEWTFPADATVPNNTTSTPLVYFGQSGNPSIKLKVSNNDGTGYYCEKVFNDIVEINVRLPKWIETKD